MAPKRVFKIAGGAFALLLVGGVSGIVGAAVSRSFGESSYTISYADFLSIMITCLGVMIAVVTLFVGLLAVLGWTSLEGKLKEHSFDYIGSEMEEGRPLRDLIERTVREAVYDGVGRPDEPVPDEPDNDKEQK